MDRRTLGLVVGVALLATLLAGGVHGWASGWVLASPARGQRLGLVSLSPAATETLFAIGAGDQLVGRSERCDYPPEVGRLPAVGDAWHPDLEAIVRLRPRAIVVEQVGSPSGSNLEAIAPRLMLPWLSLKDMVQGVSRLGALSGRSEAAEALAEKLRTKLSVKAAPSAPRVLLVLGPLTESSGSLWFMRQNSLHGRALEAAGARNAVDEDVVGGASISFERLLALDPDGILVLDQDPSASAAGLRWLMERFPMLRSVQRGALGVVAGPESLSTGPRILGLVDRLARHIEGFAAIDEGLP